MTYSPFLPDDREQRIQEWMRHRGTPPFVPSPEYEEAQRRLRMQPQNPLLMLIQNLTRLSGMGRQPTFKDYLGGGGNL